MLSIRTWPVADGTVSRPISAMSRRWFSSTRILTGILLGPFLVERDLVVAGHREPQRVADGRHPHAEIGGALAIDGDVDFRVRDVQRDLGVGEARQLLRREQRLLRVVGDLVEVRPEDVRRDREAAGALAAAERVARA